VFVTVKMLQKMLAVESDESAFATVMRVHNEPTS
jgi:hypothetical protein